MILWEPQGYDMILICSLLGLITSLSGMGSHCGASIFSFFLSPCKRPVADAWSPLLLLVIIHTDTPGPTPPLPHKTWTTDPRHQDQRHDPSQAKAQPGQARARPDHRPRAPGPATQLSWAGRHTGARRAPAEGGGRPTSPGKRERKRHTRPRKPPLIPSRRTHAPSRLYLSMPALAAVDRT